MFRPSTPLPAPQPVPDGYLVSPPPPRPLLLFITNVKNARTVWVPSFFRVVAKGCWQVEISINDNVLMLKRYTSRKMGIPVRGSVERRRGELEIARRSKT